jgi:hypothetical protein
MTIITGGEDYELLENTLVMDMQCKVGLKSFYKIQLFLVGSRTQAGISSNLLAALVSFIDSFCCLIAN